jgi:hypothetical protein
MKRRASIETLERLADAYAKIYDNLPDGDEMLPPDVRRYRSETAPLRTREEVDARIGVLVRQCVDHEWAGDDDPDLWDEVTRLCREPTTSGPSDDRRVPRYPDEPETNSLSLEDRVARLERAQEMSPYADRIKAQREIREELEKR